MMPYLQELMSRIIKFEVVTSIMWIAVGLALIASLKLWIKLYKKGRMIIDEDRFDDTGSEMLWGSIIGMIICGVIGGVMMLVQIYNLIQCAVLPESVVLYYLTNVGK